MNLQRIAAGLAMAALCSGGAVAQSAAPLSDTEVSKEVENPVTRRILLPLRYEASFLDGAYKATLPPKELGESWASGLSNGCTTFFLSPEHGEGFYWGAGPVLYYPSAGNSALGPMKWGSGPSAAFIKKDESPWVFGAVVNNIWSFGGPGGTNQLYLNPRVSYHFGDGWSVSSSPEITANWIASGGKWTVPVGGGFGKALRLGEQPIRLDLDAYYNAIRPKAGNDTWLLQVKLTFVFP